MWTEALDPDHIDANAYEPLKRLGVVKDQNEFTLLKGLAVADKLNGQSDTQKKIISTALANCTVKVDLALTAFPAH